MQRFPSDNELIVKDHMSQRNLLVGSSLLLLAFLCLAAKVVQFYGFALNDFDTGIYSNVAWNLLNGEGFHSDVLNRNHLGVHFSPLTALFSPIYAVFPSPMVLMIGQGLAVGIAVILLYRLGTLILEPALFGDRRPWIILAFCLLAFFYGPFTNALLSHFHPPTVAMPVLAGCLIALIERRTWLLAVLIVVLLTAKENAPLAVAGLGVYAALVQGRWRLGIGLGVIALVSLALVMQVIMPAFQEGSWALGGRLDPLALPGKKLLYLFLLILPLGFLPLLAWRASLAALPLIAVNLAVGYEGQLEFKYHYNDLISIFLLVAAMHGLNRLGAAPLARFAATMRTGTIMAALIVLALVFNKGRSPITDMVKHWPSAEHWRLHQELAPYRQAPSDQAMVAQSGLGPYLSTRHRYMMLKTGWRAEKLQEGDLILLSDVADDYGIDIAKSRKKLNASPGIEQVHRSELLSVHQVLNATASGTDLSAVAPSPKKSVKSP